MNNLKPIAEGFFHRVRKSTFDTVDACKDAVKGKIQEQSFKATSTIILEPEATEIIQKLVEELGGDKNKIVSDIIKEYVNGTELDFTEGLLSKDAVDSGYVNVGDINAEPEKVLVSSYISHENKKAEEYRAILKSNYEDTNSESINYNEMPMDDILPLVAKKLTEEYNYYQIQRMFNLTDERLSEICSNISYLSQDRIYCLANNLEYPVNTGRNSDSIDGFKDFDSDEIRYASENNICCKSEYLNNSVHSTISCDIVTRSAIDKKDDILSCIKSGMGYFDIKKHLYLEDCNDFEEIYTQLFGELSESGNNL